MVALGCGIVVVFLSALFLEAHLLLVCAHLSWPLKDLQELQTSPDCLSLCW